MVETDDKTTKFTLFEAEVALHALKDEFKRLQKAWEDTETKLIDKLLEIKKAQQEALKPQFNGLSVKEIKELATMAKAGLIPKDLLSQKLGYSHGETQTQEIRNGSV